MLALLALSAGVAQAASLTGWLDSGSVFPNRALVLIPPAGAAVSSSTLHVAENGAAVRGLSVTPTPQAGPGDFGLVLVVQHSLHMPLSARTAILSMTGQLAHLRRAQQELGIVGLDRGSSLIAPLSTDAAHLQSALRSAPASGSGADVPSGVGLALAQLRAAHVALGAVIVVSDGVGTLTADPAKVAAVSSAAAAAHVPIFTVGLQDQAATPASLTALGNAAPGQSVQGAPSRLGAIGSEIYSVLTRAYVARWRSVVPAGRPASVLAQIDHVPGSVAAGYQVPAARPSGGKPPDGSRRRGAPRASTSPATRRPPAVAPAPAQASSPAPAAAVPFWSSAIGTLAVAGIVGVLVGAAVLLALHRPSRRGVRMRVGTFVEMAAAESPVADSPAVPQVPSRSIVHRLENSDRWRAFALDVEIAHNRRSPIELVKRALLLALVSAAVLVLLTGSGLFALVPLVGWWFALRKMMARAADKQREKFRVSLPGYLQDLASAIRVGRSLVAALTVVAESAEEPTKSELERAVTDEALGRPLDLALEAVAKRMDAPDLDQVALIAALNRRSGSNVAEALDRVSEGARERQDLKREVKA
ncbi:MAG TPA: type II secretion system F family protein, partial [Solirubrobacteraceae bacterium]